MTNSQITGIESTLVAARCEGIREDWMTGIQGAARRAGLLCTLAMGFVAASQAAAQPELIVFSEMGANTTAMDLNDAGQVLITGPSFSAWRWQNGVYEPLVAPAPINAAPFSPCYGLGYGATVDFVAANPAAINEAGVIAGSALLEFVGFGGVVPVVWANPSTPVRWHDTAAAPNCCLCADGGFNGISNNGVPVGSAGSGGTPAFAGSGVNVYTVLPIPSSWSQPAARARNSSGLTVGYASLTGTGGISPVAWPPVGSPYALPGGTLGEIPTHVNEQGQILSDRGALYEPDGTRTVVTSPNGTVLSADLNDLGVVLGGVYLRKDGVFYDIRNYLPTGFALNTVRAINNKNWVVGSGHYTGGSTYGFLLKMNLTCFAVSSPIPVTNCPGSEAAFSITPTGTGPFTYQWRKGGAPIDTDANPSATTATLTLTNVQLPDADFYDCIVTNACGTITSNPATLTVCIGEFNCDGGIDGGDVGAFFGDWEAGNAIADVNTDGGIDGADVSSFFEHWEGGC